MMNYAADAICQFARVPHVRDLICAYASVSPFRLLIGLESRVSAILGRVQGAVHPAAFAALASPRGSAPVQGETLLPMRHEHACAASAPRGAAVGGCGAPPSSTSFPRRHADEGRSPLPRARMCTDRARATRKPAHIAHYARYRRKYNYITYGHSIYLMITVPIDTMLIINNLQIFNIKSMGQIIQIGG